MATPPPPPLTLAKNQPYGIWQCCTCITDYKNGLPAPGYEQPWETNEGGLICRHCIMPLFETAMKFDFEYPARWGGPDGVEMRIDDFAVLWPDGVFPASYKAKGAQLLRDQIKAAEDIKGIALPGDLEVQPCPRCKVPWALWDGCNHMTCKSCRTSYCFICGKEALGNSGHWSNPIHGGSCPRYGPIGSGTYDTEEEDEEENEEIGWTADISFETWSWNVMMQNASGLLQLLMQHMLGLPVANMRQGELNFEERRLLLRNMLQYWPEHGVSREVWAETVVEHRHEAMAFLRGGNFVFENGFGPDPVIVHGVLARPVGGVFNLASESARRDAYEWAQQRYDAWTPATADHPLNFAIFDIGPGALEDRVQASELLVLLADSGEEVTQNQMEFTSIRSESGVFLLAQVTGFRHELANRRPRTRHHRENPLSNLRFEFIRPQNRNEIAQQEFTRQDIGWRVEPLQRHVHFDLDEQAVLADIEEMHQNRMPRVEIAAQNQQNERRLRMDLVDGLRRMTPEERQRQDEGIARVRREMRQERRAQAAALAAEADNETITGRDDMPARAEENAPRHRRSPFSEQSLEPWAQPWDELTRAMPGWQAP